MNVSGSSTYMDKVISISQYVQGRVVEKLSTVAKQADVNSVQPLKAISSHRIDITI